MVSRPSGWRLICGRRWAFASTVASWSGGRCLVPSSRRSGSGKSSHEGLELIRPKADSPRLAPTAWSLAPLVRADHFRQQAQELIALFLVQRPNEPACHGVSSRDELLHRVQAFWRQGDGLAAAVARVALAANEAPGAQARDHVGHRRTVE